MIKPRNIRTLLGDKYDTYTHLLDSCVNDFCIAEGLFGIIQVIFRCPKKIIYPKQYSVSLSNLFDRKELIPIEELKHRIEDTITKALSQGIQL